MKRVLFGSLSLLDPVFGCTGIGYSVFSHGSLNRALEMKSPPPPPPALNLGTEILRGEAANQGMGATRANHSSSVSGRAGVSRATSGL